MPATDASVFFGTGTPRPNGIEADAVVAGAVVVAAGSQVDVGLDDGRFTRRHFDHLHQVEDLRVGPDVAHVDADGQRLVGLIAVSGDPQAMQARLPRAGEATRTLAVGSTFSRSGPEVVSVLNDTFQPSGSSSMWPFDCSLPPGPQAVTRPLASAAGRTSGSPGPRRSSVGLPWRRWKTAARRSPCRSHRRGHRRASGERRADEHRSMSCMVLAYSLRDRRRNLLRPSMPLLFDEQLGELAAHPGREGLLLGRLERLGTLRRHRTRLDALEHAEPAMAPRAKLLERPRPRQIELGLRLVAAVAFRAVRRSIGITRF